MATLKQKKAFKETGVNGGNISKAMKTVGYGKTKSDKLTSSRGWLELMDQYLPDKDLAKVHKEGLEATDPKGKVDYSTRHKYLDSGYKLKGKYAPEKSANLNVNISQEVEQDTAKLKGIVKKVISEMKENER